MANSYVPIGELSFLVVVNDWSRLRMRVEQCKAGRVALRTDDGEHHPCNWVVSVSVGTNGVDVLFPALLFPVTAN